MSDFRYGHIRIFQKRRAFFEPVLRQIHIRSLAYVFRKQLTALALADRTRRSNIRKSDFFDVFLLNKADHVFKALPHNSSAALAMPFLPSASCRNLDLPPVNLRFLQSHLTKNAFAIAPTHLCGIA